MSGFTHERSCGRSAEWYTPPSIFEALGIRFDLDPCAPALPAAPWLPVDRRFTIEDDGMAQPWEGRVWLNPPYGTESGKWVGRLREHGDGIALVFTRLCTPWAQGALEAARAVCFIAGRVEFVAGRGASYKNGRSRSGAPSMLVAFGHESAVAVARSGLGVVLEPAA